MTRCCLLLAAIPVTMWAQQAQISGAVKDPSDSVVSNATVEFRHEATQTRWEVRTNREGLYFAASVPPGEYRVSASAQGFQNKVIEKVQVEVAAKITLDISLAVGTASQTVTVDAQGAQINATDASVSTVVNQAFVKNMPLNGRSFQSLLTLIPGVVVVPSSGSGSSGEISVNGMRTESNYFMVDGVSANTGVNVSSPGRGAGYSGSVPSGTTLGTTQSLVSVDALEEFRGLTSTYSAEYGRSPGGQFSFTTRAGTNAVHGSLYEYFRNDKLDATSFFNNRTGIAKGKMRQNDFGGTLGGPVWIPGLYSGKDKTFFFFSYEALRLRTPQQATVTSVPSVDLRNSIAPPELRQVLNAHPLPTAGYPALANYTSSFVSSYSQPSSINSTGIRLDHHFSDRFRVFGRYAYVPSSQGSRSSTNMAQYTDMRMRNQTMTLGATQILGPRASNELRFNSTWADQISDVFVDDFGGATPLRISDFDGLTDTDWALFSYRDATNLGFWLNPQNNRQLQMNLVNNFSYVTGRHSLKAGVDWRRTRTSSSLPRFYLTPFYMTAKELLTNTPSLNTAYRSVGDMAPVYQNLSLFLQDEWSVSPRLKLSLGLRWELTPAPRDANGNQPFTVTQLDNQATMGIAPQGSDLWKTTYKNFAPRFGVAYQLRQSANYQTVLRAGAGLYYDSSSGVASEGYWYGLGITGTINRNGLPFPLSAQELQNIPLPSPVLTTSSYAQLFAFDPNLQLPRVIQWNTAIEQQLGSAQTLSVSYVGSRSDRLLLSRQYYPERFNNPNFPVGGAYVYATINGVSSSYDSLQAQFRRHLARGLQVLGSYTWSHAIDDATSNFRLTSLLRASSDYDIRHNFQSAISYELPRGYSNAFAKAVLGGWGSDARIFARSATPVDVLASTQISEGGISFSPHPNIDPSQPLYVSNANAPGGRVINIAAFSVAPNAAEGNAGRNVARGFATYQVDVAVRREFAVHERVQLTFRAEAFNLFNHANFGAINNNMQTNTAARPFGWATGTLAGQLGGMNTLYQVGGPRSMQLALRLQF